MLISLGVMSGVMALAAHLASGQLRFFRKAGELAALRGQVGQASSIAASMLQWVSPTGADITVALDSAIEVHTPIAAAFVCASTPGRVTISEPTTPGNTLASFVERPDAGDRMAALFEDTLGITWLTFHVAEPGVSGGDCAHFPHVSGTRTLILRELVTVPAGAALRFTRPVRLSLYRGSDNRWYLGVRDWNGETQRFNTIQPVAGPLKPYGQDAGQSGLQLVYRDKHGAVLLPPVDPTGVASITIISRATSGQFNDSTSVTVALRNAR